MLLSWDTHIPHEVVLMLITVSPRMNLVVISHSPFFGDLHLFSPPFMALPAQLNPFSTLLRPLPESLLRPLPESLQAVMYKGTVPHCPEIFVLDGHHKIERGRVFPVCGNTYSMLKDTRFAAHFDFIGDQSTHYGIFENCGRPIPFESAAAGGGNVASCC